MAGVQGRCHGGVAIAAFGYTALNNGSPSSHANTRTGQTDHELHEAYLTPTEWQPIDGLLVIARENQRERKIEYGFFSL